MIAPATRPNRCQSMQRLLLLAEFLRQFSFAMPTPKIHDEIAVRAGREWSKQTLLRDLELLQSVGAVQPTEATRGGPKSWRWVGVRSLLEQRPGVS